MLRIVVIAWFGWQSLTLPVNVTVERPSGANDRCCCCVSAATCQCGCEQPSNTTGDEDRPAMSNCDCNDAPAVILNPSTHRDEQSRCVSATQPADSTCNSQAFASFMTSHLRGPPPDLLVVQSTILLV